MLTLETQRENVWFGYNSIEYLIIKMDLDAHIRNSDESILWSLSLATSLFPNTSEEIYAIHKSHYTELRFVTSKGKPS